MDPVVNTIQDLLGSYMGNKAPKIGEEVLPYISSSHQSGDFYICVIGILYGSFMAIEAMTKGKDCILQVQRKTPTTFKEKLLLDFTLSEDDIRIPAEDLPMLQVVLSQEQKNSLEEKVLGWLQENVFSKPLVLFEDGE